MPLALRVPPNESSLHCTDGWRYCTMGILQHGQDLHARTLHARKSYLCTCLQVLSAVVYFQDSHPQPGNRGRCCFQPNLARVLSEGRILDNKDNAVCKRLHAQSSAWPANAVSRAPSHLAQNLQNSCPGSNPMPNPRAVQAGLGGESHWQLAPHEVR
jgi:hypothetical protein